MLPLQPRLSRHRKDAWSKSCRSAVLAAPQWRRPKIGRTESNAPVEEISHSCYLHCTSMKWWDQPYSRTDLTPCCRCWPLHYKSQEPEKLIVVYIFRFGPHFPWICFWRTYTPSFFNNLRSGFLTQRLTTQKRGWSSNYSKMFWRIEECFGTCSSPKGGTSAGQLELRTHPDWFKPPWAISQLAVSSSSSSSSSTSSHPVKGCRRPWSSKE